jgi:hypothetical protein
MPKFEVQHYTLCDGWINTWSDGETGEPTLYDSFEDALEELDQFLLDEEEAYLCGNIEDKYQRSEFKIVEVQNA